MPAASLRHSDRPTLEDSDNHRIRQVALANQPITLEGGSLVNLLQHPLLLSALLNQLNLALAPATLAAASLAKNLEQVAASLDRATLLRRPNKVVASSVRREEQLAASAQGLALGPGLAREAAYLVATINSSSSNNNNPSLSHLVGQLPLPEEVLGLVPLASAPITIIQTIPAVVYSAILVRPILRLGKPSNSQLKQTHLAASGLKTKTRQILNHPSEASVLSSNKSKSQADCLALRLQITQGEVVSLGT